MFEEWFVERNNDVVIENFRAVEAFAECFSEDGGSVEMEKVPHAVEKRRKSTGVEEVGHDVFPGWAEVGEDGRFAGDLVEEFKRKINSGAFGHRSDMNDCVRGAADGHVGGDGVFERFAGEVFRWLEVFPNHIDDAQPASGSHAGVGGVDGGDRRGSGKSESEGLGDRGHCGSCAHRHAVSGAGCDVVFEVLPIFAREIAGPSFGPVAPDVGSGSELFASPGCPHHCSAGHKDDWNIDHDRSHEKGGHGLVTTAHENRAIDGVGAEGFLDFHREHVAVEHRGGLHEGLAETHHGHFDRVAAGLPDAAFDFFGALAEVGVAGEEVVPGIENGDDRLALIFLVVDAELLVAGAVTEGAKVIGSEEAVGAKLFG